MNQKTRCRTRAATVSVPVLATIALALTSQPLIAQEEDRHEKRGDALMEECVELYNAKSFNAAAKKCIKAGRAYDLAGVPFPAAYAYSCAGEAKLFMEEYEDALELFERTLDRYAPSREHALSSVCETLEQIGRSLMLMERYEEALDRYQEILKIHEEADLGIGDGYVEALKESSRCFSFLGRHEDALSYLERVMSAQKKRYGRSSLETAHALLQLGQNTAYYSSRAHAIKQLETAELIFRHYEGEDSPNRGSALLFLGRAWSFLGNRSVALEKFDSAAAIFRKHTPEHRADLSDALFEKGMILLTKSELDRALETLREVRSVSRGGGEQCPLTEAYLDISTGRILTRKGRLEEALSHYEKSAAFMRKKSTRSASMFYVEASLTAAQINFAQGRFLRAFELLVEVLNESGSNVNISSADHERNEREAVRVFRRNAECKHILAKHNKMRRMYTQGYTDTGPLLFELENAVDTCRSLPD